MGFLTKWKSLVRECATPFADYLMIAMSSGVIKVGMRMRRGQSTPFPVCEGPPKRILIIQLYDTLGDVICTSPLYRELASSFPDAQITVVVSASGIPGIMEKYPY